MRSGICEVFFQAFWPGSRDHGLRSAIEIRDVFSAAAVVAAVGLMSKYADVPMDFPDATLVWSAQQSGTDGILTLDRRGFSTFRFGTNRRFKLLLDL